MPSPTWPKSAIGIERFSMSSLVSAMHSASREIGTQTSVATPRVPGRSCRHGEVGIVPRLPQPRAVLLARRPLEIASPPCSLGDRLHGLGLLLDARRGAVEFDNSVGASRSEVLL